MKSEHAVFDPYLHHLGLAGEQPFFVVIGAMDGVSFDEFHGFVRGYGWSGLLVEPMPEQFRRLRANFARLGCSPHNRYENSAIAEHDGRIQMLSIRQEAVDTGLVHPCFGGMSAIYPPRNGLASAADAPTVARYGELIEVPCISLATLLSRHAVEHIDVLCIDAEGWDWKILRQLDFGRYRPRLIRCEFINLQAEEQADLLGLLERERYLIHIEGQNLDAVALEHWQAIEWRAAPAGRPAPQPAAPLLEGLTLVTSVFEPDLGAAPGRAREEASDASGAACEPLLQALSTVPLPLLVFTQAEHAALLQASRPGGPTYVRVRGAQDFRNPDFEARLQQQMATLPPGAEGDRATPLQALVALSPPFLLNDASLYNPFAASHFLWIDAALLAGLSPEGLHEGLRRLGAGLREDTRLLLVRDEPEVGSAAAPAPAPRVRVMAGGKQVINTLNGVYYAALGQALAEGRPCSFDALWQQILHTHSYLCHALPAAALAWAGPGSDGDGGARA